MHKEHEQIKKIMVKVSNELTKEIEVATDVKQGSSSSPFYI